MLKTAHLYFTEIQMSRLIVLTIQNDLKVGLQSYDSREKEQT